MKSLSFPAISSGFVNPILPTSSKTVVEVLEVLHIEV